MKKILVIAILFFTLACQTVMGTPTSPPVAEPTAAPPPSTTPTAVPTEAEASPTPTPAPVSGFEEIRLHSKDGRLNVQLEEQARFAAVLGLMPVVEFDASW